MPCGFLTWSNYCVISLFFSLYRILGLKCAHDGQAIVGFLFFISEVYFYVCGCMKHVYIHVCAYMSVYMNYPCSLAHLPHQRKLSFYHVSLHFFFPSLFCIGLKFIFPFTVVWRWCISFLPVVTLNFSMYYTQLEVYRSLCLSPRRLYDLRALRHHSAVSCSSCTWVPPWF